METHDILQCVERGLRSFGLNMKMVTFASLESGEGKFSDEILSDPEAFERALKTSFGSGYKLAARAIVQEINKLCSPNRAQNLVEALEMAKGKTTDYRTHRDSAQFLSRAAEMGAAADLSAAPAVELKSGRLSVSLARLQNRARPPACDSSEHLSTIL